MTTPLPPFFHPFWELLETTLFNWPSSQAGELPLWNPYRDADPHLERPDGPQLRRDNLRVWLQSYSQPPEVLLVGEAPGWRGARFSGVPFTSEAQLAGANLPFQGRPTSLSRQPYSEISATLMWGSIRCHHPRCLAWNAVPLHPYPEGKPLANRRPAEEELVQFAPFLARVSEALGNLQVVAVGRSALAALALAGVDAYPIRHPAHGGAREFRVALQQFLGA
jgi:uracil-DNA glycosylase